jgi:hypothetical protein
MAVPLFAAAQAFPDGLNQRGQPVDPLPELTDEEARRARLREAGRQAEQLRNQLETLEQERLRNAYPAAPATEPKADKPAPLRFPATAKEEPAGHCDGFSREMEAVIREEMRGGSRAVMEELAARRQQIYLARLRAGC